MFDVLLSRPLYSLKLAALVFCFGALLNQSVLAEAFSGSACEVELHRLQEYPVKKSPRKILLAPLLYHNPEYPREHERWPEPAARRLTDFYRGQFQAKVHWLREIRTWDDYFQQTDDLIKQGEQFDRVVFIAHGGFDGPVMRNEVLSETRVIEGDQAKILQISEAQPGNEHVVEITNSVSKNTKFNDYVTAHWQELLKLPETGLRAALKEQHQLLQPMDNACYAKFCGADKLKGLNPDASQRRLDTCEKVCRPSIYSVKYYERVSEKRFGMFANSLKALVKDDGLVFMGECNAGTPAPKQYSHWDTPGIVVSSKLAGGPYRNYVNLLSSATDRIVAGPIGSSSAEDVVNRIFAMENNHEQRFLCMAQPMQKAGVAKNDE